MSAKLVLPVDPFDIKKFSNLSLEILVQWIAPIVQSEVGLWFEQWSAPFQNKYGYRAQYSNN